MPIIITIADDLDPSSISFVWYGLSVDLSMQKLGRIQDSSVVMLSIRLLVNVFVDISDYFKTVKCYMIINPVYSGGGVFVNFSYCFLPTTC